jgi:transposase
VALPRSASPSKKLGLGYRKARGVPAKADPLAQRQFLDAELRPRLAEAATGKRTLVFADAAHFVRGAFLGYLWCLARWVVPTGAGRQRYNVLGAVNPFTHEMVRETNDGVVDRVTAGRLLRKIRERYPTGPITVVWDNARYQHTALVRSVAAYYRIELLYLPPYSPNLNVIERVWKFVKADALANRWRTDFAAFRSAIDATLDQLHTTHRERMRSLLALNFQVLEPASISTA